MKRFLLCFALTSIQLTGMQQSSETNTPVSLHSLHEICSPQYDSLETKKINERAQKLLDLLQKGADVNGRGWFGRTPIFSLAVPRFQNLCHKVETHPCDDPESKVKFIASRLTLIGILLANGADITIQDEDHKTVLDKAEERDDDNFNFKNGMVFKRFIENHSFQATPSQLAIDVTIVNTDPLTKPGVQINVKKH